MEMKKVIDGSEYPPETLKSMMFVIGYYYQNLLLSSLLHIFLCMFDAKDMKFELKKCFLSPEIYTLSISWRYPYNLSSEWVTYTVYYTYSIYENGSMHE